MQLRLPFPEPDKNLPAISHHTPILLAGSCFSENIGKKLSENKFRVLSNPYGILFSPPALANCLEACLSGKVYRKENLVFHEGIFHHWDFHSSFSSLSEVEALNKMNAATTKTNEFLQKAGFLILTLGTAFQYYFQENGKAETPVANCHKLPTKFFKKRLCSISEIHEKLEKAVLAIRKVNPGLQIIFTVSPMRHLRDGLEKNNRSKARLLESAHQLCETLPDCFYFPAYEILTDILRDYRFYDADMAHPNNLATEVIWEQFERFFFTAETINLVAEIKKIRQACYHKPFFPGSPGHHTFVKKTELQIAQLEQKYPFLDFGTEKKVLELGSRRMD